LKFGPVDVGDAKGAILAHAVDTVSGRLKKGKQIDGADISAFINSGLVEVIVARLEESDVEENEAARLIAGALSSADIYAETPFTGRANLFAKTAGLLQINAQLIDEINQIDPGITIATLPQLVSVEAGRMVATVKIIPFAVKKHHVNAAIDLASGTDALDLRAYQAKRIGLIATELPSLKRSTMDKTRKALDARLVLSNSRVIEELRVPHTSNAVAEAIHQLKNMCDLLVVFGASAIIDEQDIIPSALRHARGKVDHFGMPVDPGNLLLLGHLDTLPVIGAPGCARSPIENGFDWILQRLLANIPVCSTDITSLGVGGLLKEIHSRPQPRQPVSPQSGGIHTIVMAAGQSRRMGKTNKLLAELDGKSLIRRVVESAIGSDASDITVVTGFEPEKVEQALSGLKVKLVHNPDFASGLASTLRSGVASLPSNCRGVLVLLADMPHITTEMINQLIEKFNDGSAQSIIQAASHGKRGNPVLWASRYFDELTNISGDVGARHLIGEHFEHVVEVELGEAAAMDIDTPAELLANGGKLDGEN
jgi:molybdenum cofactor cytidylyltransferase